jgi:hypothetical protein
VGSGERELGDGGREGGREGREREGERERETQSLAEAGGGGEGKSDQHRVRDDTQGGREPQGGRGDGDAGYGVCVGRG